MRPEECGPCKAQDPPKVGYCAPARCYCLHPECPAYVSTHSLPAELIVPIHTDEVAARRAQRSEETAQVRAQLHADLKARREGRRSP